MITQMRPNVTRFRFLAFLLIFLFAGSSVSRAMPLAPDRIPPDEYEDAARNMVVNITVIMMGGMTLSFADDFAPTTSSLNLAQAYADLEDGSLDIDSFDALIDGVGGDSFAEIAGMATQLNDMFARVEADEPELFARMFANDLAYQGVDLSDAYELSDAFMPLTFDLTLPEMKRYMVYLSMQDIPHDRPVDDMWKRAFAWLQELTAQHKADPEIAAFMERMQN